ncbi:MAG: RtcB family protein, partial [Candidatus Thermoplasmatota archaeon]|nr:RtcB family protein [Candidatus Thermoplasmatota archaeon]
MRVPAMLFGNARTVESAWKDGSAKQAINVSTLPSILKASIAMPDIHGGYGFPIGGVAAFDYEEGIISPGGVGYDINCGVSLFTVPLT